MACLCPESTALAFCPCLPAAQMSQTQKELWQQLTLKQLPTSLASLTPAEATLNTATSGLVQSLLSQSTGNGTQLIIANAVWTNKTTLSKQYQDSMMKLFQVKTTASCWPIS